MALSKMFVKAEIQPMSNGAIFVAKITYSFYGLYHYDVVSTHATLEEARNHILAERCGGFLVVREA